MHRERACRRLGRHISGPALPPTSPKSPPLWPPTCDEIFLLPAGVQQPAAHGSGRSRVDELYVLVRALKHLERRSRSEQLVRRLPRPPGSPAPMCLVTLICLISYWIRLIGFPYISFPESTSFAETAFARITATERRRGQRGWLGTGGAAGWDGPTQPPHPTGAPTFAQGWLPAANPPSPLQTPSCPWTWLSCAVPKGTGLWHAQDGDGQCCSSAFTAGDKGKSPQDCPAPLPPAVLDQSPLASTGSVPAQPLLDSWAQVGPARARACHPDGTETAKTCQQRPGSTALFAHCH